LIGLDASAAVELVLGTQLAERSAYDGVYVALAEALAMPLLTCDGRLARAHGHGAKVELIADVG